MDNWKKDQHYIDKNSACNGLSWTAGEFPSAAKFNQFDKGETLVEEEEEEMITAKWGPPKFETVLSGLED